MKKIPKEDGLNLNQVLTPFDHCVNLLYPSKICDVLYNNDGLYLNNQNVQVQNTLTVIFTFGDSRILKWRRTLLYKTKKG